MPFCSSESGGRGAEVIFDGCRTKNSYLSVMWLRRRRLCVVVFGESMRAWSETMMAGMIAGERQEEAADRIDGGHSKDHGLH